METSVHSLWSEPRAPGAPQRVGRDWALVAAVAVSVGLEVLVHSDRSPLFLPILVVGVIVWALLRRRTNPLLSAAVSFGAVALANLMTLADGGSPAVLYSAVWILLIPYSLFRWGSGREVAAGLGIMLAGLVVGTAVNYTGVGDVIGAVFLLFPGAVGALIRVQRSAREQQAERVRLEERAKIARELHDTVAHHVSAIAIQAQAGRFLAGSDSPEGAADALAVIEEEASRTLVEMRTMVGLLRRSDSESGPQDGDARPRPTGRGNSNQGPTTFGLDDLEQLVSDGSDSDLRVEVSRSGSLDSVSGPVSAAVFRLAQESVTNATRHARNASRVSIQIHGGPKAISLTVCDDGDPPSGASHTPGFGLIGMNERADLIGGTFEAGPGADRGWMVRAMLPRNPSAR